MAIRPQGTDKTIGIPRNAAADGRNLPSQVLDEVIYGAMDARELYSVEQVAELLGLHVRTVRGYVRDGRLPATRIGKQYRIARADVDALTGRPAPRLAPRVEASSVVHVDGVDARLANRLRTTVLAAVGSRGAADAALRVEVLHEPARDRLTVVVLGDAAAGAEVLRLVAVLVEGAQ
jgi:excisionase family DNA binding protein